MTESVLRVEGLHVTYRVRGGSYQALHDVDLELGPGEVHGVVGESGCGKSTLASAIMRLLPPNGRVTDGRVLLGDDDLGALDDKQMRAVRGARIGMVFQDPLTSLNPTFQVSTQMINAQRAHLRDDRQKTSMLRERAVEMLDRVGIDDPGRRVDDYPHQFSGGMRQRIMIATVLLLRPQVLICDEATSALDVTLQAQILDLLRELCREQETSLIVVSHDIGVIGEMCDRVSVLYAGRVVESGEVTDVLARPSHPYTRKLVAAVPSRHRRHEQLATIPGLVPLLSELPPGCTFAPRCDAAQEACRGAEPALVPAEGRVVRCLLEVRDAATTSEEPSGSGDPRAPARDRGEVAPLVETNDLCVHFSEGGGLLDRVTHRRTTRTTRAVDGVELALGRAEILGLVGESGSGKTTLGKTLLGLVPATSGQIRFDGAPLLGPETSERRDARRRMRMIFQETYGSLSPRLRVERLVTEPYRIAGTPAEERHSVEELLALVGLSAEQAGKYPHQLSGGQARRVGIARALALEPDFVVADEPTSGLDVSAAASVLQLLQDLRERLSLTLLIITHDLNLVGYVADRIAVMQSGRLVEIGSAEQVMDAPRHTYTQQLLRSIPEPLTTDAASN